MAYVVQSTTTLSKLIMEPSRWSLFDVCEVNISRNQVGVLKDLEKRMCY